MTLSDDETATWSALATVLVRLPAALDAQLQRDAGLTHFEYGLLYALDTAPGRTLKLKTLAGYASCTLALVPSRHAAREGRSRHPGRRCR